MFFAVIHHKQYWECVLQKIWVIVWFSWGYRRNRHHAPRSDIRRVTMLCISGHARRVFFAAPPPRCQLWCLSTPINNRTACSARSAFFAVPKLSPHRFVMHVWDWDWETRLANWASEFHYFFPAFPSVCNINWTLGICLDSVRRCEISKQERVPSHCRKYHTLLFWELRLFKQHKKRAREKGDWCISETETEK